MDGLGIIKGMGVTLKRFLDTYLEDIQWLGKRYYNHEGIARRMSELAARTNDLERSLDFANRALAIEPRNADAISTSVTTSTLLNGASSNCSWTASDTSPSSNNSANC